DPSSSRSGGSILGDKTRMEMLSRRAEAFIRPSPSGGTLGGVARRTREALLLCEAAGHDVVLVETVGVGQSEVAVAGMVDVFVLLLSPGAGDDLQGVKRGIVELADIVVVNKADGDLAAAAERTAADYANALHFLRSRTEGWEVRVERASALLGEGIDRVWSSIEAHEAMLTASGALDARRAEQARDWMWSEVNDGLVDALASDPAVAAEMRALEADVQAGTVSPTAAAQRILRRFLG
ncbi:MAG: GTPase, partial [Actinomycetota bacterium]|nr:GTPase [Actinomycetota bacterium]